MGPLSRRHLVTIGPSARIEEVTLADSGRARIIGVGTGAASIGLVSEPIGPQLAMRR